MDTTTASTTDVIDELLTAYNTGDDDRLGAVLAPDVRWHFGFRPFPDLVEGRDAVVAMFRELRRAASGANVEARDRLIGDDYAMLFSTFSTDAGEVLMADALRVEDGCIAEYWTMPNDVATATRLAGGFGR